MTEAEVFTLWSKAVDAEQSRLDSAQAMKAQALAQLQKAESIIRSATNELLYLEKRRP